MAIKQTLFVDCQTLWNRSEEWELQRYWKIKEVQLPYCRSNWPLRTTSCITSTVRGIRLLYHRKDYNYKRHNLHVPTAWHFGVAKAVELLLEEVLQAYVTKYPFQTHQDGLYLLAHFSPTHKTIAAIPSTYFSMVHVYFAWDPKALFRTSGDSFVKVLALLSNWQKQWNR